MPSFFSHDSRRGGKSSIWLLALLVALSITHKVLRAHEWGPRSRLDCNLERGNPGAVCNPGCSTYYTTINIFYLLQTEMNLSLYEGAIRLTYRSPHWV
jgi:hypothetical protein